MNKPLWDLQNIFIHLLAKTELLFHILLRAVKINMLMLVDLFVEVMRLIFINEINTRSGSSALFNSACAAFTALNILANLNDGSTSFVWVKVCSNYSKSCKPWLTNKLIQITNDAATR